MANERIKEVKQVGDVFSRIANVSGLVRVGRVPISLGIMESEVGGGWDYKNQTLIPVVPVRARFYNIPPQGFTLGRNGCTGRVDLAEQSIEYFDGKGKSLGGGQLVTVRLEEAVLMDEEIAQAREEFGY